MQKTQSISTKKIVLTGMFAAVLAVMSQLSIPMPSGVPITLQTFGVALTAYVLGWKLGVAATAVYILVGAVGAPVFSNFQGGFPVLVGMTGGFIWGFLLMVLLCGFGVAQKNKALTALFSIAGLVVCHFLGVLQFMAVSGRGFAESALLVSVPYLVKDVVSIGVAYFVALAVRRGISYWD